MQRALAIDGNYAPAYNGRGLVYDKLNDFENACLDFNKSIELDQNNPVYIHNRGCCKRSMNKYSIYHLKFQIQIN